MNEMINITNETRLTYAQLPLFLYEDEKYSHLSLIDIHLYTTLFNRYRLSLKNNMRDENGYYVIYTRKDLCKALRCTEPTLRKSLKKLAKENLIEDVPMKLKYLANKIYLYLPKSAIINTENSPTYENQNCATYSTTEQDSYTENKNEIVEQDSCTKNHAKEVVQDSYTHNNIEQEIKEQICYDELKQDSYAQKYIDTIVDVMKTAMSTKKDYLRINGSPISAKIVLEKLKELTVDNIKTVLSRIKKKKYVIKFIKSYLLTSLFNTVTEYKKEKKYSVDKPQSYDINRLDELAINLRPFKYPYTEQLI